MSFKKPRGPGVVVLGDINIDILARIGTFAGLGEDCLVPELQLHCGGVGANTAIVLAKWGIPVRLVGRVGRDCFGDRALRFLRREKIDVSRVQRTDRAMTGLMFIVISADGQRTFFGSRGANAGLAALAGDSGYLGSAKAAHLVGYNFLSPSAAEVAEQLIEEAHRHGRWVSLDVGVAPSRQIPQKILQVAKKVDILFVSLDEAIALTGTQDKFGAFRALEPCGVREVVIKLGEKGCLFREDDTLREVPTFSVPTSDTTGAGDAFAAAFLRARLHGWSNAEAALLANAAGAATAAVVGAGESMPAPRQILRLLRASRLDARWDAVRIRVLERLRQELGLEDSDESSGGQNEANT